ncbi:MAG TPA: response regulator, partial [Polyangiales bacterium]|nr:response regulator [Polyangiales bacterium]
FDVILCDLMMPHMTGMELHAKLLRSHPEQAKRMVFMTAGAFTPRARAFLESVPNPRLEKPFDPQSLRALIERLAQE